MKNDGGSPTTPADNDSNDLGGSDKTNSATTILPGEALSLPPTASSVSTQLPNILSNSASNRNVSGAISINYGSRNVLPASGSPTGGSSTAGVELRGSNSNSPVSLPSMASLTTSEKRSSVRELAASLAKQTAELEAAKQKKDSLPRNTSPSPANSADSPPQGLHEHLLR